MIGPKKLSEIRKELAMSPRERKAKRAAEGKQLMEELDQLITRLRKEVRRKSKARAKKRSRET